MNTNSIASLAYISTAAPGLSDDSLEQIGGVSMRNNTKRSITGLLGYNGTNFIQVLEGSPDAIHQCLTIITTDNRHSGIVVINQRELDTREFPDWSMKIGRYGGANSGPDTSLSEALTTPGVSPETLNLFTSFRSLGNRF